MTDYDTTNIIFDRWDTTKWDVFAQWKPNSISGESVRKIHKYMIFSYLSILMDIISEAQEQTTNR